MGSMIGIWLSGYIFLELGLVLCFLSTLFPPSGVNQILSLPNHREVGGGGRREEVKKKPRGEETGYGARSD